MQKKYTFLIVVILLLFGTATLSAFTYTKEFKKTVDFEPNGEVSVKNTNGRIEVTSWEKSEVEIYAEIKVKAGSQREGERLLEKVEIIVEKMGDRLRIEPDYPQRDDGGFLDWVFGRENQPTVNFFIKVPKQTDLTAKSTNGHLSVSDIEGDTQLGTTNGGIDAEKLAGPLDAHTTNGSIKVYDLKGSLDAHTTNGSITASVTEFHETDEIDMGATNASIRLTLPSDVKADVSASTVNGSIHTDFPLTVQGKIMKKRLQGEINGGGGKIELSTVNGSIHIGEE